MSRKLVDIFLDLVKIDSPSSFEKEAIKYTVKYLSKLGIYAEVDSGGNVFAYCYGKTKPVLLSAHLDTVEPGRGIKPQVNKHFIKSNGTTILGADNKANVAAILTACGEMLPSQRRSIEIVFSVKEETDGGINEFDINKLKSKEGLVADTAEPIGAIILAAPWIEDFEAGVFGKASHTSIPEEGINSIVVMTEAISKLKWGKVNSDTTTNVGVINGGYVTNTIPPFVEAKGEVRSYSRKHFENSGNRIESIFRKTANFRGAQINFNRHFYCSGYKFSPQSHHVVKISDIFKRLGIEPDFLSSFGGSDANFFNSKGVRVVNIGDGVVDAHTTKERIALKDLFRLKDIYSSYISI